MTDSNPKILYCYRHPNVETGLRCNRCERPICSKCAIHTETGYRCPECIREQRKIFDTARWYDFLTVISISLVLSTIGSVLAGAIGFFTLLLSPLVGIAISEIDRLLLHRRRSQSLFKLVWLSVFIGGLIPVIPGLISILSSMAISTSSLPVLGGTLYTFIWPVIYSILASSTCYYRLAGMQLR